MGLFGNSKEIENVYANGKKIDRVFANGKLIWESTIYVEKPTVTGAYTYNTAAQSAVITGYDEAAMTISGTRSATEAGTYHVYFTLNKGYAWKDESTAQLDCTWTIAKKTVSVPKLSATSFSWVEGAAHSVVVSDIDTTYISQSGNLSQTDTASNLNVANTVTWSLKNTKSVTWTDGTTGDKNASWKAIWTNGTSHYKTDLYNCGWNSGKLASTGNTVSWGGTDQPYIRVTGESSTGCVYVNDSSLTEKGIHMLVMHEDKTITISLNLRKKSDVTGFLGYADSTATAKVGTSYVELYGKNPANTSWIMSDYYCGVRSMNNHRIQRVWYS